MQREFWPSDPSSYDLELPATRSTIASRSCGTAALTTMAGTGDIIASMVHWLSSAERRGSGCLTLELEDGFTTAKGRLNLTFDIRG